MELPEYKKRIAGRIENRLKELGISRKRFSEMMDVQPSRVTQWLSGNHNFTMCTMHDIEWVLEFNLFNYESLTQTNQP